VRIHAPTEQLIEPNTILDTGIGERENAAAFHPLPPGFPISGTGEFLPDFLMAKKPENMTQFQLTQTIDGTDSLNPVSQPPNRFLYPQFGTMSNDTHRAWDKFLHDALRSSL
jgi:hypothetical protein